MLKKDFLSTKLMENRKTNKHIIKLIKKYPNILSGRKNYLYNEKKIFKTLKLIEKFLKTNN